MTTTSNQSNLSVSSLKLFSKTKTAIILGIGKKKLEKLTNEGKIRFLAINGRKVYPFQALQDFIDSNLKVQSKISDEQSKSLKKIQCSLTSDKSKTPIIDYNSIIHKHLKGHYNGNNYN